MSNRKKKSKTLESDASDRAIRTEDPVDAETVSKTERIIVLPSDQAKSCADNERGVRRKKTAIDDCRSKTERTLNEDDGKQRDQRIPGETSPNKKSHIVKVVNAISGLQRENMSESTESKKRRKSVERGKTISDRAVRTEPPIPNLQSRTEIRLSESRESFKDNEIAIKTPPLDGRDMSRTDLSSTEKLKKNAKKKDSNEPKRRSKKKKRRKNLKSNEKYGLEKRNERKSDDEEKQFDSSEKALRTPPKDPDMRNVSRTEVDLDDFPISADDVIVSYVAQNGRNVAYVENVKNRFPAFVSEQNDERKKWLKILFGVVIFVYSIVFVFQMWRLFKALAASYEVSIDDCQLANSLCQRYSMCCFNQCGASRFETFWSKLLNG